MNWFNKTNLSSLSKLFIITIFILFVFCGGGEDSEKAGNYQEQSGFQLPTEYPQQPGEVVMAFFNTCKYGELRDAFETYLIDGEDIYKNSEKQIVNGFKPMVDATEYSILDETVIGDQEVEVVVNMVVPELDKSSKQYMKVRYTKGKWKILAGDF